MRTMLYDLRIAARALRQTPGFALVAIVTLGLGVGATAAIFSVVNPILLRPLPYPDADRLVQIYERDRSGEPTRTSWATITDLARQSARLEAIVPLGSWQPILDGNAGDAEVLSGQRVGWRYFQTLGVAPALGRAFRPEEDTPSGRFVVMLSDGLWRRRFGADAGIVGRSIMMGGRSFTVVGVMPRGYENVTNPEAQIWRPLGYDAADNSACRTCRHLTALGRVAAGTTREQAEAELSQISEALVREYPRSYSGPGIRAIRLQDDIAREARPVLLVVLGAVGFLLLAACANVAHLLLARAIRRERELSVRVALGAGRARLASQFLAESLVLCALGGALAVLIATFGVRALVAMSPEGLPRLSAIRLDGTALLVAALVTLGTAVVLGLVPALAASRANLFGAVRSGTRIAGGSRHVARAGLVTVEIALALMLLSGAGLLGRSLMRLLDAPLGFDSKGILAVDIQIGGTRYSENAQIVGFYDAVLEQVRALPGVTSAAVSSQMPLGGNFDCSGVHAEDKPTANPELNPCAQRYGVSADWARTLGIPLLAGRAFTTQDREGTELVVMVSAMLAQRVWPGENAIGKRIAFGGPQSPKRTVVGVVGDVPHTGLNDRGAIAVYLPNSQLRFADNFMTLALRTSGDPAALGNAVRAAIAQVDPAQPVGRIATMDDLVAVTTAQRRFALLVFGAFAAVALALAAAGIGGMLAGLVAERTHEIGIRSALGATPASIVKLVIGQAGALTALGTAIGLAGSIALSGFLGSLLYEIRPSDPATLGAVALVLAAVALAASAVPIGRALGVGPMEAMREH